jgi:hypothetical protein
MAHLIFRLATVDDAPEVQRLIQAAFRADDTRADWVGDKVLASKFHISVDEVLVGISSSSCWCWRCCWCCWC